MSPHKMTTESQLKSEHADDTIFICIAACQERYLLQTVKSALISAEYPSRLYFGIFNTVISDKDIITDPLITDNDNVFYVELRSKVPMGVGYSRMNASLLYTRDHDFVFQIDAHTIFSKNWDTDIIDRFIELETISLKPIITATTAFWSVSQVDKRQAILQGQENMPITVETIDEDLATSYGFTIYNYIPSVIPGSVPPFGEVYGIQFDSEYEPGSFIVGAYMFSRFAIIREVLHDPMDTFSGDQVNYSLRALSGGYSIYTTKSPLMLTLNKFTPSGEIADENDWRRTMGQHKIWDIWQSRASMAATNVKEIFSGRYTGYWGAKDIETLERLKKQMGMDYYNP